MAKINKAWHLAHKMPKNPSMDERVEWHLAHSKNCECRPLSEKMRAEIKKIEK